MLTKTNLFHGCSRRFTPCIPQWIQQSNITTLNRFLIDWLRANFFKLNVMMIITLVLKHNPKKKTLSPYGNFFPSSYTACLEHNTSENIKILISIKSNIWSNTVVLRKLKKKKKGWYCVWVRNGHLQQVGREAQSPAARSGDSWDLPVQKADRFQAQES